MKFTPQEEGVLQSMVDWYTSEALVLWKEAERNAAFFQACEHAMSGLNEAADRRFAVAFAALGRGSDERLRALRGAWATAIRDRLGVDAPRGAKTVNAASTILTRIEPRASELTLQNYLHAMTSCLEAARKPDAALRTLDHDDRKNEDVGLQFSRSLWARMRDARVFDIPAKDYSSIWTASDQYTTEKIGKLKWDPIRDPNGDWPVEDQKRFVEAIDEAGQRVPFPDPLPFDTVYFGFGHGTPLSEHQWSLRIHRARVRSRIIGAGMLGYLLWLGPDGGEAVEILQIVEEEDNYILPNLICHRGVWLDPMFTLGPWIVTHLVSLINEHRQIVLQPQRASFSIRRDFEKKGKQHKVPGLVPRPYYVVRLEKKLIEDTGKQNRERLAKISRELAYRHDRRGHERCYIRRGQLPLDAKDSTKLTDAGYKVWTVTEPDSNAYRQLMERGQPPKGATEWIAVLTKWIDPTVVGPDDKPYIPALRIPTSSRESSARPHAPREV